MLVVCDKRFYDLYSIYTRIMKIAIEYVTSDETCFLTGMNGSVEDGIKNDVIREAQPFTVDSQMAAG